VLFCIEETQPGYQPDEDFIVGVYDLSSPFLDWDPITVTSETYANADGENGMCIYALSLHEVTGAQWKCTR
jgi:hypothetical protein